MLSEILILTERSGRIKMKYWKVSDFQRVMGWLRFEKPSGGHLIQALLKQDHLELVVQNHVQTVFENHRRGHSTASVDNLCQCWSHSHIKKRIFWSSELILCSSLCPLPLVQSLGSSGKCMVPSFFHPPFRHLYILIRSPKPLLFPAELYWLSVSPHRKHSPASLSRSWPYAELSPVVPYLLLENLELDKICKASKWGFTCAEFKERITTLSFLATLCLMQARIPFATRTHCWLVDNLVSTRTLSSYFLNSCFYSSYSEIPSLCWYTRLLQPGWKTSHFPLLNFTRVMSAQFSRQLRSCQTTTQSGNVIAIPSRFVPSSAC